MATRGRTRSAEQRLAYDVEAEWTKADLVLLQQLREAEALLPDDAPRALLSVRLSVLTEDTTSPVRQELDLRQLARDRGMRVVGIASDLNVSATKIPPWKRKSLGDWLNNRAPEFDAILFWKMDRFVRNAQDMNSMLRWCKRYDKNLVSKNDPIDRSHPFGELMATFIATIAQIEAANTALRVASLWAYTKTQTDWHVGKPAYGYDVEEIDGHNRLVINQSRASALHEVRKMILAGASTAACVRAMKDSGQMSEGLTVATLGRRMRNPALLGYRVEEDKQGGIRRSKVVRDVDGAPLKIADQIFSQDEYDTLQTALDARTRKQPVRANRTPFLGVVKCADCECNMSVRKTNTEDRKYNYMKCTGCKTGGIGVSHPENIYRLVVDTVLTQIGHYPVQIREFAKGAEARQRMTELQESITYYMTELAPGGRFNTRFTREAAQAKMEELITELDAIDPDTTEDRWVRIEDGKTFREHWEAQGDEAMSKDLLRTGVVVKMKRLKVPGQRQPRVELKLITPKDLPDRLVQRPDEFADQF